MEIHLHEFDMLQRYAIERFIPEGVPSTVTSPEKGKKKKSKSASSQQAKLERLGFTEKVFID